MAAIIFDRRDDGLDRFFAKLLGAMLRAIVEQLFGIGRLPAGCGAGINGGGQIVDRETRHYVNSIYARDARPRRHLDVT